MNEHSDSELPDGVSRRTITRAMAWAVPVIAVAAAAPAYAASQPILQATGEGCKLPGNSGNLYKGYAIGFTASNPYDVSLLIRIDSIILNGTSLGGTQIINLTGCIKLGDGIFTIPPRTSYSNLVLLTKESGNSQAGTLTATYTIVGGPGGTVTASASVDRVPPIQGGDCTDFTPAEKQCIAEQNRAEE